MNSREAPSFSKITFVTIRGSLHGIEAIGETRFVLSVGVKISAEHRERTRNEQGDQHELGRAEVVLIGS